MPDYMISATCAAALIGIIMSVIFCRLKILNFRTAASITIMSLVMALIMPGIFSMISLIASNGAEPSSPVATGILSLLVYLILVIVFTIVISNILPKVNLRKKPIPQQETVVESIVGDLLEAAPQAPTEAEAAVTTETQAQAPTEAEAAETTEAQAQLSTEAEAAVTTETQAQLSTETEAAVTDTPVEGDAKVSSSELGTAGDNYIENIYLNFVGRNDENISETVKNEEIKGFEENAEEKSVDSIENIDKMGIENNIHDNELLTIEECIDEAFRLRVQGDLEGSILYYMYALDKKPQKELTFWIVLDICVMYKILGQQDLALDILDNYYDIYGEEMDNSVRKEIESNLTGTHA